MSGHGPVWPGFTLSGYLSVKANGVRMGRACPDCGSPEPALALALAPFALSMANWMNATVCAQTAGMNLSALEKNRRA